MDHEIEHRNDDQGQKGGSKQTIDNGPGQWSPKDHIISSKVNMRVKVRKEREEIHIESYR